jgi:hypothetical protein
VAKKKHRIEAPPVLAEEPLMPRPRLTEMVPVRFPSEILTEVRRRANADDRSVSAWIRRAVERELRR